MKVTLSIAGQSRLAMHHIILHGKVLCKILKSPAMQHISTQPIKMLGKPANIMQIRVLPRKNIWGGGGE